MCNRRKIRWGWGSITGSVLDLLNVRQVGCQRWKLRGKSGIGIQILESMGLESRVLVKRQEGNKSIWRACEREGIMC